LKILKTLLRYCFIFISILICENVKANALTRSGVSSDATLKSIVLSSSTTLIYTTGPSDYNYTTSVSPNTPTLSIEPTTNDPNATVTINGAAAVSGQYSTPVTLNGIVTTTINIIVTASDGVTTHSYTITVFETGSNNAFLSGLSISTGNALVASNTGPGTFNYTTSVAAGTSSISFTAITADPTATVSYNGSAVTSGTAYGPIALNPTLNATTTITVKVLAQDGVTTQTYSIIVTEAGSNNALLSALSVVPNTALTATSGSSNFNYTTSVKSGTLSIKVKAILADPNASITVNGAAVVSNSITGISTTTVNFPIGGTTINLVVTAQDGVTKETYSIQVVPNANSGADLSSFPLSASYSLGTGSTIGNTTNYTIDIDPAILSVTETPTVNPITSAGATITVNGVAVANGTASGSITLNPVGSSTLIAIVVTSQDGLTTKTTNITVNRNGSNNDNLGGLSLSTNTSLVVTSGSSNVNYKTSVPMSTGSLTVTPTAADPNATITVNGNPVVSGQASGSIILNANPASTPINLVITAQDKSTQTVSITVFTNGSNNANLGNITVATNPVTSSPSLVQTSFTATSNNYSTSVSSSVTALNITPTAADPSATLTYNGSVVASGSPIPVALGAIGSITNFVLSITSPDGSITKTVNIAISRTGSNNDHWNSMTLSTNTTLTSSTGSYNVNYTSIVSPHTFSVAVTTVTADPNATITVNGLATVSGSPSLPITLNNNSTLILVQITAQDGVSTQTTGITITRSGSLYTWTGGTSNVYNLAANWSPAKVPTASDVASIGETPYTGPPPTINNAFTIGELYFGSTPQTTLTINAGSSLTIGTSLTIDAGAVTTINSNSHLTSAVNIAAGATVNFPGTGGQLVINSSTLPVIFTLKSTSAGSASVGQITTSSIVGTVSVQRYITGGSSVYRGYRLLSSPVYQGTANGNNIYSLNYVQATSLVVGTTGSAGGFNVSPGVNNPSLFLYREDQVPSNATFTSGNYWGISAINNSPQYNYFMNGGSKIYNIPVGNGFEFFYRGDNINNLANKYTAGTVAEATTMTTTGTLNAGPITVSDWFTPTSALLSYTTTIANGSVRGFNLVGNPYASNIDWDTYSATLSSAGIYAPNVSSSVYVLDPISKNFGVYVANSGLPGTNNATHILASGQGFFVLATAAGAQLTFNESAKTTTQVTGSQLLLGKPAAAAVSQYLHLKLKQDSVQADEIFISFNSNASSKFVVNEDAAQKPGYGIASLASMSSDGVSLSINTLKLPQQSEAIALNVNAVADGTFQLIMPDVKSVPALFDIWLMDAYKKDSVDFKNNPAYSFNIVTSDSASYGSKRFSLVIRENPALALRLLNFTAAKVTNGAQIVWKTVNEENYTNFTVERSTDNGKTFDVLGGVLSSNLGTYGFLDKAPSLAEDQYRLKLEDFNGNISYSNVVTLLYSDLSNGLAHNSINVYPNPASSIINLTVSQNSSSASNSSALQTLNLVQTESAPLYDIKIISISGAVIKAATSSQPNWEDNVSNLLPGTYIILVQNSGDKSLVGKSMFVKL
jgi:hypothetical protein